MALYLGILLFSFIITAILLVPFIDLLYKLQLIQPAQKNRSLNWKVGTPIGGGVLFVSLVTLLFAILFPLLSRLGIYINSGYPLKEELNIIFFTFISFGLLGLFSDISKIFNLHLKIRRYRLVFQILLSIFVAMLLYFNLQIQIINIPFIGVLELGWVYLPVAAFIIYMFSRGLDITDGLDGMACGILLICLLAFWAISVSQLDTPLSIFLGLWTGSLIAFLYFNVYPARLWLGNSGSLAFGAALAVTGLLLGKIVALLIIGGFFWVEALFNFIQQASVHILGRPAFSASPLHLWLLNHGWPEPKIVMRAWLATFMLSVAGLWLAGF